MNFHQGEIVYIKFPFTDLSNYKLRPALIISNHNYNKKDNILLIGIFGNEGIPGFSLTLDEEDLESGKMLKQSFLRYQNIFSLDKKLVERKIGKLKISALKGMKGKLDNFIQIL